ncbi:MAG: RHS repeat-associated core domain-containing protein [Pirellulaceae bacterium]
MYDPMIGQFLSEDPIGFNGDPSNLHRYVKNQPLTNVDPDGKRGISIFVDPTNLPPNFDPAAVSRRLQQMFAAA